MLVISVSNSLLSSLVSRPFHQLVIACMQNGACKNGGGWPGQFYHVNDISVYLGRQRGGGVPGQRTSFGAFLKRRTREQNAHFQRGTPPPSVYLGRHWLIHMIHMIKWTRPSPSVFAYCKWSKTGRWEGLWTRLFIIPAPMACTVADIFQINSLMSCTFHP